MRTLEEQTTYLEQRRIQIDAVYDAFVKLPTFDKNYALRLAVLAVDSIEDSTSA